MRLFLTLQDENGYLFKATLTREPNLHSSSKWYSAIKYINNETITFQYIKSNGSYFYFEYKNKWYRLLKYSFNIEEIHMQYTIIV
jgi:hypothetical protein